MFKQLETIARSSPEAQANGLGRYLDGILEGAIQADPFMRSAFGAEFKTRLCGNGVASAAQTITLSRMILHLPDQATTEGFDCFFARAKEDVPLWSMMDAWRNSGLEKTPALARLEAAATDSRTRRRFLPPEEEMRQRMAAHTE